MLPASATETTVRILSYIMEDTEHSTVWRSIFSAYHHTHDNTCSTTELWWKANLSWAGCRSLRSRRHGGAPDDVCGVTGGTRIPKKPLTFTGTSWYFMVTGFTRLNSAGGPPTSLTFSGFSKHPLPHINRPNIYFLRPLGEDESEPPCRTRYLCHFDGSAVTVLDLRKVRAALLIQTFTGLSELHLDFAECGPFVEVSEEELPGIFYASPRLESLSVRVKPRLPTAIYSHSNCTVSETRFPQAGPLSPIIPLEIRFAGFLVGSGRVTWLFPR